MTRPLAEIRAEPQSVLAAMRHALAGDGPAILPRTLTHERPDAGDPVPSQVARRIALVVETSGSSGRPKRVALSADALLASAAASESALGGPGQWLLALPAHYIAGVNVLVRSITSGTEPVMVPAGHFDAQAFAEASDYLQAPLRFASLVPAQLLRLLDAAERELSILEKLRRFDRVLVGGQAAPPALVARSLELGLNVTRTYGSSETAGGCVYDGVALPGVDVRCVDGEVQLGGVTLADGYLDDELRTEQAFVDDHGQHWYRTGDSGQVDAVGTLRVTGRLDAVIISGGVKVSLDAIERVVAGLPGFAGAVAVRAPSEQWGEVPVVFSTAATGSHTSASTAGRGSTGGDSAGGGARGESVRLDDARLGEIRVVVEAQLGRAARPAALLLLDRIPMLSSGKLDRQRLTKIAADWATVAR